MTKGDGDGVYSDESLSVCAKIQDGALNPVWINIQQNANIIGVGHNEILQDTRTNRVIRSILAVDSAGGGGGGGGTGGSYNGYVDTSTADAVKISLSVVGSIVGIMLIALGVIYLKKERKMRKLDKQLSQKLLIPLENESEKPKTSTAKLRELKELAERPPSQRNLLIAQPSGRNLNIVNPSPLEQMVIEAANHAQPPPQDMIKGPSGKDVRAMQ